MATGVSGTRSSASTSPPPERETKTSTTKSSTSTRESSGGSTTGNSGADSATPEDNVERADRPSSVASDYIRSSQTDRSTPPAETTAADGPRPEEPPPYNPTQDAEDLYGSMHGGLGWGTDEDRLFRALEGRSPSEMRALEAEYEDHYGRNLRDDIRSELGGQDLRRAEALLSGDHSAASADALATAMNGLGTDEQAIFDTLEGRTAQERADIAAAYERRHGVSLETRFRQEMSGTDLDRAQALLRGDTATADAARLRAAMAGLGTDEAAVYATLEGRSPEQIQQIQQAYAREYGNGDPGALRSAIEADFGGAERDRALALLDGQSASADAARLRDAMAGLGTDEAAIESVFEGKTPEERQAIERAYQQEYGDLNADLRSELNDEELSRVRSIQENGELSAAEQIYHASRGWGTDERTIHETLDGMSRDEIAALREDYRARYGQELDEVIQSELGGRDLFEAEIALRGRPETAAEARDIANERYAYEREGTWNAISNAVVDTFSDSGRVLERNHTRLNAAHERGDGSEVRRLAGYVNTDVDAYREAEDSVSDAAGTAAATAAGVAVVIGSGGTATPLVIAMAAGAGGGARVLTEAAISGSSYSGGDALADGAVGAVDGAFTVVGAGVGNRVAREMIEASAVTALRQGGVRTASRELVELTSRELLETSVRRRVVIGATQGAIDGAIGGAAGGAAEQAFRDGTWDNGVLDGLGRVATGAGIGGTIGAVAGGGIGGGSAPLRRDLGIIDQGSLRHLQSNGDNHWYTVGRYDDMLTVNRVVGGGPQRVAVPGAPGEAAHVDLVCADLFEGPQGGSSRPPSAEHLDSFQGSGGHIAQNPDQGRSIGVGAVDRSPVRKRQRVDGPDLLRDCRDPLAQLAGDLLVGDRHVCADGAERTQRRDRPAKMRCVSAHNGDVGEIDPACPTRGGMQARRQRVLHPISENGV